MHAGTVCVTPSPSVMVRLQVERGLRVRRRRGTLWRGSTQVSPCLLPGIYGRRDRGMRPNTYTAVRLPQTASVAWSICTLHISFPICDSHLREGIAYC